MKVINGNNIDILKQYPDNYFDAIVTDPPYGLGKEPNAVFTGEDKNANGFANTNLVLLLNDIEKFVKNGL